MSSNRLGKQIAIAKRELPATDEQINILLSDAGDDPVRFLQDCIYWVKNAGKSGLLENISFPESYEGEAWYVPA